MSFKNGAVFDVGMSSVSIRQYYIVYENVYGIRGNMQSILFIVKVFYYYFSTV